MSDTIEKNGKFLTIKELAAFLGVGELVLWEWRKQKGKGPPYHRIGGRIRYKQADIDQWIQNNRHE